MSAYWRRTEAQQTGQCLNSTESSSASSSESTWTKDMKQMPSDLLSNKNAVQPFIQCWSHTSSRSTVCVFAFFVLINSDEDSDEDTKALTHLSVLQILKQRAAENNYIFFSLSFEVTWLMSVNETETSGAEKNKWQLSIFVCVCVCVCCTCVSKRACRGLAAAHWRMTDALLSQLMFCQCRCIQTLKETHRRSHGCDRGFINAVTGC